MLYWIYKRFLNIEILYQNLNIKIKFTKTKMVEDENNYNSYY